MCLYFAPFNVSYSRKKQKGGIFLHKIRNKGTGKLKNFIKACVPALILLILWQLAFLSGKWSAYVLPGPEKVWKSFVTMTGKERQKMQEIIRVSDVEKYYGNGDQVTKAVDRVSFAVQQGEFIGVMGASGSGKTTLLNLLSTIDRVTAGHIYYGDTDITELGEEQLSEFRKKQLGFIFQEYNLLDTLTLEENIMLVMTLHRRGKKEIQKRCRELLRILGIEEVKDKYPYQVSGGQKQRCACARALANYPTLLLADEPTGALDSLAAQTLLEIFTEMNKNMGATILMVTHDAFSASYCSRILFLKDGRIFHELVRGEKERRAFLNEILDVMTLTGGERSHDV